MSSDTKYLLKESYASTKRYTGVDPRSPKRFREGILPSEKNFKMYADALSESMMPDVRKEFQQLAKNTRIKLLENSTYSMQPYETLTMPILSIFYPRLIARELVTVDPIDKPEVIKAFLQPIFIQWNNPAQYAAPSYNNISSGPSTTSLASPASANVGVTNLLSLFNLTSETSHIERDLVIYTVTDANGNSAEVNITPDVSGNISGQATINGNSDFLTGSIDYYTGVLTVNSSTGVVKSFNFSVSTSLEENIINPYTQLTINKIRLLVKDRELSAQWSVQFEQDIRALYDIDLQAELVTVMGQQIALDVDREIINTAIAIASNANITNTTHTQSFSYAAPSTFAWGPKQWYETALIPILTMVSGAIYTDTNIQSGDVIACNPIDASILESLNGFVYDGTSQEGGDLGFRTASLQGKKWKVIVSPVVPQGNMLMTYKPDVELKAVFLYAPYVPAVIMPYPMQNKPAMTVLSRYATALVRPNGFALVKLTNFNQAYGQGTVVGFNGVPGLNT